MNYLAQMAAAQAWFDDTTDRLRRAGARQVAPDMFEIDKESADKILREIEEKKDA